MHHEARQLVHSQRPGHADGSNIASFPHDPLDPGFADRHLHQAEGCQRRSHLFHQRVAGIAWQVRPGKQQVAHGREAAKTLGNAFQRSARQVGAGVFQEDQNFFLTADFSDCGRYGTGDETARRDQSARFERSPGSKVDQILIGQDRRAGYDDIGNFRLVFGKAENDAARNGRAATKRISECTPNLRRRIVEQEGHRHLSGAAIEAIHLRVDIGATERTGGAGAFTRSRRFHPAKKCLYDHLRPTRPRQCHRCSNPSRQRFKIGSPCLLTAPKP
ncbi:hypothetical protein D9M72_508170 [compost metagenome]